QGRLMLRSTAGNWLNYSTTITFQIAFARSYGATSDAAAFTSAFVLAIAIGSILSSTAQVIALPRLFTPAGELRRSVVLFMAAIAALTAFTCLLLFVLSEPIGNAAAGLLNIPSAPAPGLLRYASAFTFLAVIANEASTILLARGL